MSERAARLQALLQGHANGHVNGHMNGAGPVEELPPPPPPPPVQQPPAFDLSEFAAAWRTRRAQAQPQRPPAPVPTAPPVRGPAQAMAVQQGPTWRQNPDGSLLSSEYTLEWGGLRGDPSSPISLRRLSDGASIFDGPFGVLQAHTVDGVWVPFAARPEVAQARAAALARQTQLQGMGAAEGQKPHPGVAQVPQQKSTARKVLGAVLGLGAIGVGVYSAVKIFGKSEESK